nr:iron-containing alcohol dehydrogenase [uncultured Holophaga sp.]
MKNFVLYNPTRLFFGAGQIAAVGREIPKGAKVLMTYGGGSIKANGVYEQVIQALDKHTVLEFGGIEPNPCYETLIKAVELAREEKVDFLLAVGGGSTLDGTKFISAAVNFEGDPWDILKGARPQVALPLGSVMTLPATGSEMNSGAVISRKSTLEKFAFSSPLVFPRFSVVDPEVTYSLPPRQIANGVVDAFVHVMEQYLTYPADAPIQDRFAEGILQTLLESGPKTLADPADYTARANVVFSATMALNGLIGVGVPQDWSTHLIGHELTVLVGLDHAQTLAIVMPNLLWVQRDSKREKLLQYAERVWGVREGGEAQRIEEAIIRTRGFFESMGNPTHLSDYSLDGDCFDEIVRRFKGRNMLPCGEKRDLDEARLRQILAMCR